MAVQLAVDFEKVLGQMKPMHGIGQPPMPWLSNAFMHYLTDAGIPYSRLHDVGGWMGGGLYVDIPNIFPDFDADENNPDSYDFAYTDVLMKNLVEAGVEPYFRLGVTIENLHMLKAHRIFPPKDFAKWARVCEHVVRHYNEGWANGYRFNVVYWEIWNEPDDCYTNETAAMWKGTPEQYFELYAVTAKHLKACFGDTIKVGGYGHCGLYEYKQDKHLNGLDHEPTYIHEFTISFMHNFFRYQVRHNAPIDFFSWHVYDMHSTTREDFTVIAEHAAYVRKILDKYGYTNTEHHLNEWNLWTKVTQRDHPRGAAKALAFMLLMQNTSTDVMCFYDGGVGYSAYAALINADTGTPYRTYYAMVMFNSLYRLKNQVLATSDDKNVFIGAAKDENNRSIVIANVNEYEVKAQLNLQGGTVKEVLVCRIDEKNHYTQSREKLQDGILTLPANSCVEIQAFDME